MVMKTDHAKQNINSIHEGDTLSRCIPYSLPYIVPSLNCLIGVRGVRFPVGTMYLQSFTSLARDSKWGCRL